jgi:acyl carrier protein
MTKKQFMEMKEFVSNFAAQFDETEESVFTPETRFREIEEWSSLVALSVIAMVDEEYDVTLKGDDIKNSETIADIYNTVASKL